MEVYHLDKGGTNIETKTCQRPEFFCLGQQISGLRPVFCFLTRGLDMRRRLYCFRVGLILQSHFIEVEYLLVGCLPREHRLLEPINRTVQSLNIWKRRHWLCFLAFNDWTSHGSDKANMHYYSVFCFVFGPKQYCNEIDFEVQEAKMLMGLEAHQVSVKSANSLEWQSAVPSMRFEEHCQHTTPTHLCWIYKFSNYIGQVFSDVGQLPKTHIFVVEIGIDLMVQLEKKTCDSLILHSQRVIETYM